MSPLLLIALCLQAQPGQKGPPAKSALPVVAVETSLHRAHGLQIVSVVLRIQPTYFVYANPQPDFGSLQSRLVITTRNPKTIVRVIYPEGRELKSGLFSYRVYEECVAIQAIVQRVEGDNSPLEGLLLIEAASGTLFSLPAARVTFTLPAK
jgi:hypothetical protein